jgi:hypothetical protein
VLHETPLADVDVDPINMGQASQFRQTGVDDREALLDKWPVSPRTSAPAVRARR